MAVKLFPNPLIREKPQILEMARCSQTGLCFALVRFHCHAATLFHLSSTRPTFFEKPLHHVGYYLFVASPYNLYHNPGLVCSPFSRRSHGTNWATLKPVTISAAFIGLCLMSIINFATAEIGALLLVPTCLMAQPIKPALRSRRIKSLLGTFCSIVLVMIGFPVMFFAISKGLIGEGLIGLSLGGEFWTWLESLWAWKSATYLYIGMVHLPCWLLCLCILFHPS